VLYIFQSERENPMSATNHPIDLQFLLEEVEQTLKKNSSTEEVDKNIRNFFTEDSIIERTRDCNIYFQNVIRPTAKDAVSIAQIKHN
jgi:hypothetical protein